MSNPSPHLETLGFEQRQVEPAVTFPLIQQVLRQHETVESMHRPDDEDPDAAFFAVFDRSEEVVATGIVRPRPAPWAPDETGFRIQGMATRKVQRGRGLGSAVLGAIIGHVHDRGGGLLWCNARIAAQTLYEHAGFTVQGPEFTDPHAGVQVPMARVVD